MKTTATDINSKRRSGLFMPIDEAWVDSFSWLTTLLGLDNEGDGSLTRKAATADPKPLICSQSVAREGKEVEFRQLKTKASSKLLFLLSPVFIHFLALSTVAQLKKQFSFCYPNDNYTTNSTFEAKLNHLLDSFTMKTGIDSGFYNFSNGEEDRAYAIGICRPDMDLESCGNCISAASISLTASTCPNVRQAIGGIDDGRYNFCMLRYSNYEIFGLMENAPYIFMSPENNGNITENLVEFNQTRNRLLKRLFSEAAASNSLQKYAVGNETVTGNVKLYALVQCNPDLSEADCNLCLNDAAKLIPECCDKKEGGRVITPSCSFRYETNRFYKASIEKPTETPSTDPRVPVQMISS
ncbi:hypothetical protein EZV62_026465 [Acer yangbiense]|uniref:Gnk2-homologous domain-containing protein n=1 Tax=Acer yangbiense TaxID=1000413 RepID=A0A5C7GQT8_9ROSI|nr:hypothetical protein EZV62_026465 [Acer yangbiense]